MGSNVSIHKGFPQRKFDSMVEFCGAYIEELNRAFQNLDKQKIALAADALVRAFSSGRTVYVCGNGGSAAIANHHICDFVKGVQTNTQFLPRVVSLSGSIELITAIANDIAYDDIFVFQIKTAAQEGDVLLSISSSGNSENICRALAWAKANKLITIAMCGFDGGRSKDLAEIVLHVDGFNYGIVEDVHQSLMHILAQHIRQAQMSEQDICRHKF